MCGDEISQEDGVSVPSASCHGVLYASSVFLNFLR